MNGDEQESKRRAFREGGNVLPFRNLWFEDFLEKNIVLKLLKNHQQKQNKQLFGANRQKNVSCEAKLPHSAPCPMGWDGVSSAAADVTGPVGRFTVMARASNLPCAAQPQPTNNPSSLTRRREEQRPHYLPSLNTPQKNNLRGTISGFLPNFGMTLAQPLHDRYFSPSKREFGTTPPYTRDRF